MHSYLPLTLVYLPRQEEAEKFRSLVLTGKGMSCEVINGCMRNVAFNERKIESWIKQSNNVFGRETNWKTK